MCLDKSRGPLEGTCGGVVGRMRLGPGDPALRGSLSFESGVPDSVEVSEDVDGYEDRCTRLLVCVFGGRVICGLGRKLGCDPPYLSGFFAGRSGGAEAGL